MHLHPALAEAASVDPALAVGIGLLVLLALAVGLLVSLGVHVRRAEARLRKLDGLDELRAAWSRAREGQESLDLRRVEHVLIDIRDGQKRLEERLLALVEAQHKRKTRSAAGEGGSGKSNGSTPPASGPGLSDRIVDRLLALGYERVEIITPLDKLETLAREGGEARVEARRDGALHKGRVLVRGGSIADVQLRASYEIFP